MASLYLCEELPLINKGVTKEKRKIFKIEI